MLDDDQSDTSYVSTSSIISFHPPEDKVYEPNRFPSVGFDLFEENMLEENFSFPNDQIHANIMSLEAIDENLPSQELLLMMPKWDDDKCDSTQIVLIDLHEINLEKTFEENHPINNNLFGVVYEGNG